MAQDSLSRNRKAARTDRAKTITVNRELNDERSRRLTDTSLRPEHRVLEACEQIEVCWGCVSSVIFVNQGHNKCYRCGYPATGKLIYKRVR